MARRTTRRTRGARAAKSVRPEGRKPRAPSWRETELQRRLSLEQTRYRALVESLPLVAYAGALDVQGSFSDISPQVETLLGYKPSDWLAGPGLWLERLHRDDRPRVLPMLVRAHRDGRPFCAEYRLLDISGRPHWIRDESRVVRDEAGKPLFVQGTWTEITQRKELELETAGKGRELRSSQAQLEQFVSASSHELMAPLRRIVNLGELLAARAGGLLDEQSRLLLERMRDSAARLQRLVAGLVEYWEHGRSPRPAVEVSLATALDEAVEELAGAVSHAAAEITRGPLPPVLADPVLLRRVLVNLLDNALRFRGEERPRIAVWAERSGDHWVVCVRDNGMGMSLRDAQEAFSLFDTAHPGRGRDHVGLGLPLSKKIVEGLGGRIWVESSPGEGSTFRFALPAPSPRRAP